MEFGNDFALDCELEQCDSDVAAEPDSTEAEEVKEHQSNDAELEEYDSGNSVDSEDESEEEYSYEVLDPEDIVNDMLKKIVSINTILDIPDTAALVLLHYFKWDEEKLLEKFYTGDRSAVFKDAHIVDPAIVKIEHISAVGSTDECDICLNPLSGNLMTGLECGHRFCGDCWDEYLTTKVMGEGECLAISCPAAKCDILVSVPTAMILIKDYKVKTKYQHLITQSFVECNRLLKWCPTPDCNRAVKVQYVDYKPVICKCGQVFCFKCNEKWHAPLLCRYLKDWLKKIDQDLTAPWIVFEIKECPCCKVMIEKIKGCSRMTCSKCKHRFCWVCTKEWLGTARSHHDCYQDPNPSPYIQLKKYLSYKKMYIAHKDSLQLENNLHMIFEKKLSDEFLLKKSFQINTQYFRMAIDVLRQCRQTIMNTYAFAYYLERSNQTAILENNLIDLVNATKTLSDYLEQDIKNVELDNIKPAVRDKTSYCKKQRKILLDHVTEGYDKDWWKHLHIA